jgi:hypothetical protein
VVCAVGYLSMSKNTMTTLRFIPITEELTI